MGARVRVDLTSEQSATLKMWAGSGKTEQRMALRARVILLASKGLGLMEIAGEVGLSFRICLKWRKRFLAMGLEGLLDKAGRGRPLSISPEERVSVVALACTTPPDGSTRWSVRKLAEATGHSKSAVQKILAAGVIKPHKTKYWCGKSPDPEFAEKQATIIGLYMNPPENALVLSVDEKSQIQALDRTQPLLPMRPGTPKRLTATYKRNGTTCLLAALAVHAGTVEGRCVESSNHEEFLKFLKSLYRKFPGKHLHVIVDNLAVHKHQKVMDWIGSKRRMTLHFTPTYSSWLNQVEIWFNIFARDVLKDGVWRSKQQLIGQIMEYIKSYNQLWAKPFKWTYTGKPLTA
ncbi:MAG: IS630 family transposase [Caldisericota bacterium]|nr:IS630 family transposase [Caldisericota bacterium]